MTLFARLLCRDVILGFDGSGLNTAARRVAGCTFLWRAFKGAADMASLAGDRHMCARQWKAGFYVIEIHVAFGLGCRCIAARQCQQEQAQYGK